MLTEQPMGPAEYARDPVAFINRFLPRNEKGQPWSLSAYQRRVLQLAVAFDAAGRLAIRLLLWSEPKKSGKTFLAACLGLWWAITRRSTEVIVAANDLEQSVSRVFQTMVALAKHNGFERAKLLKLRAASLECENGTTVTAIASEYRGAAGSRHSLVIFDELWGFQSENLQRLYEELTPPPTEPDAWVLVVSYAGFSGESTLLETLYTRGVAGERMDDALELTRSGRMVMFWSHLARQPWQTDEYYREQKESLRPNAYIRLHENRWVTGTESFIQAEHWDACVDPAITPTFGVTSEAEVVGLDAAVKHDNAAAVRVVWRDGQVVLVGHRIWKPTPTDPLDLEATLEQYVLERHQANPRTIFVADPYQMHRSITTLQQRGVKIRELPQTQGNTTAFGQALFDALKGRNVRMYPAADLREQALNAVAVESSRGWRIAKEKSSKKIDAIVALAMAVYTAIEESTRSRAVVATLKVGGRWAGDGERTHDGLDPKTGLSPEVMLMHERARRRREATWQDAFYKR